ncbi:MAG: PQQ-binding-like beta-propeller repeat protein [Pirellulales bacterium]
MTCFVFFTRNWWAGLLALAVFVGCQPSQPIKTASNDPDAESADSAAVEPDAPASEEQPDDAPADDQSAVAEPTESEPTESESTEPGTAEAEATETEAEATETETEPTAPETAAEQTVDDASGETVDDASGETAADAPANEIPADRLARLESVPAAADAEGPHPDDLNGDGSDWNQWFGSGKRNNVPQGENIPDDWDIGGFDRTTGEWQQEDAENIKWVARLGSQSYGNPVIAGGQVYVGTNNGAGYIERYPADVDLGALVCFDEETGEFLWQHSSEKLKTGRVHDWPLQGICSSPYVEGDRLWFATSRGEIRCLDTKGFRDGENTGPYTEEEHTGELEADVIWNYDMMKELGVSQHNMANCSITSDGGDLLFVITSNGLDESHINLPAPDAPSFICMDKNTGEVYWTDKSPGTNILHGQWSSPAFAVLGGVPQVIFAGGDGWIYSFLGARTDDGQPELLWKFDANPKESKWVLGGSGTRNNIIATPVIYKGKVYCAVGQDPEHGEGIGHLWCLDPTKRGDVSSELAFHLDDVENPIPHKRIQAVIGEDGEIARANPNSAVVWHYSEYDADGDGEIGFEETMHRTIGTVAIKDDILYIADFSGLFHCLNAQTGEPYWTYDMLAASWGSPLIVDGKVYIGDEDGDVAIFKHGKEMDLINEINMGNSIYSSPVVANGILYIANRTHLFAIAASGEEENDDDDE